MTTHPVLAMFLGYNTNGFAHHRLEDAISILADLGYQGVALTLDVHHLDPFAPDLPFRTAAFRRQLERLQMSCVIETGARFLLDPVHKHQPTLLSSLREERQVRVNFLKRCVEIASELNAGCVSFWSGTATDSAPPVELMSRLVDGCMQLLDCAERANVALAFEPEPGMFIDNMETFKEFDRRLSHPGLGLTIDIGHLVCQGELPVSAVLAEWKHILRNVHIEDMRRDVHDHLMFGEGEVDFRDVVSGLRKTAYSGGAFVELSRHSYDAVSTARKAKVLLDRLMALN